MNSEAWSIVGATFFGPILAVLITFWRDSRNSLETRRLHVFRTLMATRRLGLSTDHVNSLNLVEVDFYGCEKVLESWQAYKAHLFKPASTDETWTEEKEKLLATMLFEIASTLKLNIPAMEIFKGGYAPKGWAENDRLRNEAMKFIDSLSSGDKSFPIWIKDQSGRPES